MRSSETAEIMYELESEGCRLTKLRQAVIDIFGQRKQPLLVEELGKLLFDYFIKVHRASLYRELDFLQSKKIIVPVVLGDGRVRYEFADRDHHHHAVCVNCQRIVDVELSEDITKLEDQLKTKIDFKITHHTLEFFGICGTCQNV